jgi:hypothetical protein
VFGKRSPRQREQKIIRTTEAGSFSCLAPCLELLLSHRFGRTVSRHGN